ncbi:hypothetical protein, partial [Ruminococcus callidus]|uniref:hypothetical protein n=2 Tax=Ruminococcus callidus TaxID=40519 RepID=UPI0023F98EFB
QGISGQYDGKSARRLRAKLIGGLYSVFPSLYVFFPAGNVESPFLSTKKRAHSCQVCPPAVYRNTFY